MNYEIECQFSAPLDLGEGDFEYSEMNCNATSNPQQWELIENATTSFYLTKTINYGEILIITFLMLFLIFGISKFLVNFIIPKKISFKR